MFKTSFESRSSSIEKSRYFSFRAISVVGGGGILFYALIYLLSGFNLYLGISNLIIALLCIFSSFFIYRFYTLQIASFFLLSLAIVAVVNVSILSGYEDSPALPWMFVVPLTSFLLLPPIGAMVVAFISAAVMILIRFCHNSFLDSYQVNFTPSVYFIVKLTTLSGVTLMTSYFGYVFAKQFLKTTEEVEQKKEQLNSLVRLLVHDIANPLTVIKLHLVKIKNESTYLPNSVDKIDDHIRLIEELLTRVRDSVALDSGKIMINKKILSVKDALKHSIEIFEVKLKEKKVSIDFEMDENEQVEIWGDENILIIHVFNNIISNAIKYSSINSEIKIKMTKSNNKVKIEFIDFGVGIPPEILKNIFRPDKMTTRPGTAGEKGTGFGMPLVYQYVKYLDGDILIQSKINNGTIVTLEFGCL